jgi:hypothetical protein
MEVGSMHTHTRVRGAETRLSVITGHTVTRIMGICVLSVREKNKGGRNRFLIGSMSNYWIPKHKYQLVDYLKGEYPNVNWKSWSKKRLFAVYHEVRRIQEMRACYNTVSNEGVKEI